MEHVPGRPITAFADEHRLTLEQRLQLFGQVCEAIAHAHQKAIIHRDVKASNVLACFHNGRPMAKVIDFGIAKALTSDRLTELTFNTVAGKVIGTYATMSPEQAAGSADIDTRTDVYSLGVLLYELLTGVGPFDLRSLARSADDEARRIIREVEPPTPGARLTSLDAEDAERLARDRSLRTDDLRRRLEGEVAWIPLKAMRKERDRRYASVLELKEDLDNFREGGALIAGPESRAYRTAKFVGKHRAPLATLAVFLVTHVVGIAAALWGWQHASGLAREARAERERATRQFEQVEQTIETRVRTEVEARLRAARAEDRSP